MKEKTKNEIRHLKEQKIILLLKKITRQKEAIIVD